MMITDTEVSFFVLCVENVGYEASLEKRKVYRRLDDEAAQQESLVRVIDESGESYLYPSSFFVSVRIPESATNVFDELQA